MKIEYVSTNELAGLLGVTRQTIYFWKRDRKIPRPKKRGAKLVYHVPSVLKCVVRQCLDVSAEALQLAMQSHVEVHPLLAEARQAVIDDLKASKFTQ